MTAPTPTSRAGTGEERRVSDFDLCGLVLRTDDPDIPAMARELQQRRASDPERDALLAVAEACEACRNNGGWLKGGDHWNDLWEALDALNLLRATPPAAVCQHPWGTGVCARPLPCPAHPPTYCQHPRGEGVCGSVEPCKAHGNQPPAAGHDDIKAGGATQLHGRATEAARPTGAGTNPGSVGSTPTASPSVAYSVPEERLRLAQCTIECQCGWKYPNVVDYGIAVACIAAARIEAVNGVRAQQAEQLRQHEAEVARIREDFRRTHSLKEQAQNTQTVVALNDALKRAERERDQARAEAGRILIEKLRAGLDHQRETEAAARARRGEGEGDGFPSDAVRNEILSLLLRQSGDPTIAVLAYCKVLDDLLAKEGARPA